MTNDNENCKVVVTTKLEKGFDEPYNPIEVIFYKDGAIAFTDFERYNENWIYLYPDQVKAVKKLLESTKS